jgi:beta-glucosidase
MAGRTYRYFGGEALYPFGHGLSFTRFAYGTPVLSTAAPRAGEAVKVSVPVTNTGERDGEEVVQLYVSRPVAGAPVRALKGFQRIALKRGETRTVEFTLSAEALGTVDAAGRRIVEPGAAQLWIGGGQPIARPGLAKPAGVATSLRISGRKVLEE